MSLPRPELAESFRSAAADDGQTMPRVEADARHDGVTYRPAGFESEPGDNGYVSAVRALSSRSSKHSLQLESGDFPTANSRTRQSEVMSVRNS